MKVFAKKGMTFGIIEYMTTKRCRILVHVFLYFARDQMFGMIRLIDYQGNTSSVVSNSGTANGFYHIHGIAGSILCRYKIVM